MASGLFKKKQNSLNADLKDLSVSEAALSQSTFNVEKITDIQSRFRGGEVLLVPGRIFIRDGALWKVCRKGPKKRQFFLFNDILVYGTILSRGHYGNQHIMALSSMSVSADCHYMPQVDLEGNSGEGVVDGSEGGGGASPSELKPENAFQVSHSDKSFHVYSHSKVDKANWISNLNKQISKITKNRDLSDSVYQRAVWVPDSASKQCMICKQKFSAFIRKHHCRMCGRVVCSNCSPEKADIAKLSGKQTGSGKMERICKTCKKPVILVTGGRVMGTEKNDIIEISTESSQVSEDIKKDGDDSGDESSETEDSDDSENEEMPVPPPRRKKQQRTTEEGGSPLSTEEQDKLSPGISPIQGSKLMEQKSPEQKKKSTPPPRPSGPPPRPSYVPSVKKSVEVPETISNEPKEDKPSMENDDRKSSDEPSEDSRELDEVEVKTDSNTTMNEPDSNTTMNEPDSSIVKDETESNTFTEKTEADTRPETSMTPVAAAIESSSITSSTVHVPQPSPRTRSVGRKTLPTVQPSSLSSSSNAPPPRPSSKPIVDNSMIDNSVLPSSGADPPRPGSGSQRPVPKPRRTIFKKEPQQEATDTHENDTHENEQQNNEQDENKPQEQQVNQHLEEEQKHETVEEQEQPPETMTKEGGDDDGIHEQQDDDEEQPSTTSDTSIDKENVEEISHEETDNVMTEESTSQVQPTDDNSSVTKTGEDEERPQVVKRRKQKITSGDTPNSTSATSDEASMEKQAITTTTDLPPNLKSMRSPSTHARQRRSKFSTPQAQ